MGDSCKYVRAGLCNYYHKPCPDGFNCKFLKLRNCKYAHPKEHFDKIRDKKRNDEFEQIRKMKEEFEQKWQMEQSKLEQLKKPMEMNRVNQWKWKDDDGKWKEYDKETNDKIEQLKANESCFYQKYQIIKISETKSMQLIHGTNDSKIRNVERFNLKRMECNY